MESASKESDDSLNTGLPTISFVESEYIPLAKISRFETSNSINSDCKSISSYLIFPSPNVCTAFPDKSNTIESREEYETGLSNPLFFFFSFSGLVFAVESCATSVVSCAFANENKAQEKSVSKKYLKLCLCKSLKYYFCQYNSNAVFFVKSK